MLPPSLDLAQLDRVQRFRHYFRYPLREEDFRPLRQHARLRGYYAAKPLHGALTRDGRVDRASAFNGQVAAVFVPSPARSLRHAQLVLAQMDPRQVRRGDGRRNWPAIREAAERAILSHMPVAGDA
jgi:MoxR-like ATPase